MRTKILYTEDVYNETVEHSRVDWNRIHNCSSEVKQNLIPFIKNLKLCQTIYLKEPGSLALKWLFNIFDNKEYQYERMAIILLRESVNPEAIYSILYNCIFASNLSDAKYLEYAIFASFFVGLFLENQCVLDQLVLSYLGLDFLKQLEN